MHNNLHIQRPCKSSAEVYSCTNRLSSCKQACNGANLSEIVEARNDEINPLRSYTQENGRLAAMQVEFDKSQIFQFLRTCKQALFQRVYHRALLFAKWQFILQMNHSSPICSQGRMLLQNLPTHSPAYGWSVRNGKQADKPDKQACSFSVIYDCWSIHVRSLTPNFECQSYMQNKLFGSGSAGRNFVLFREKFSLKSFQWNP